MYRKLSTLRHTGTHQRQREKKKKVRTFFTHSLATQNYDPNRINDGMRLRMDFYFLRVRGCRVEVSLYTLRICVKEKLENVPRLQGEGEIEKRGS